MDFTSRQLKAFHLVAQHHSFARAAEALFITSSGLSVLIREFEHQLGFRLFERTTRRVALTAHGHELLPMTQQHLDGLETAMSGASQRATGKRQPVALGTTPLVAANILPQAMSEFRRQRPDVHIHLFDADQDTVLRRVEAGKLDLGVGLFKGAVGIRRTPSFRFSLMVIRADKAGVVPRASMTWSALNGQTLIALSSSSPHQQLIDKQLAKSGVRYQDGGVANLLDTQIALVEADEGIAIIPSFGLPACRNRRVVMSRLVDPVIALDFHQISKRGKTMPPGADDFAAFLKAYIARWAGRAGVL
jgi:LysR family transcriptional regulator, carnitine catabolism transcriptional activator